MLITFTQSGGLVGLVKRCQVDTEALEPDERARVEALVAAAGFRRSWRRVSQGGDRFVYEIALVQDSRLVCVECDDGCVPADARSLVSYLKGRAK